jgi:prevent-host-death family protein
MTPVTVQDAKTHLSRLLRRVESGEEIVISRGRRPVARLVPVGDHMKEGRVFGAARGLYSRPPDSGFLPLDESELEGWE